MQACSAAAGVWRIAIMPVDTVKTTFQVAGADAGAARLRERLASQGPSALYEGALATSAATFVGHYPWFATYNGLSAAIDAPCSGLAPGDEGYSALAVLAYNAGLGLAASLVSDTCSNSLRVLKTAKQTAETPIGYREALGRVVAEDGVAGLFGRGLQTRYVTNGLQGILFAVLWKYFQGVLATPVSG